MILNLVVISITAQDPVDTRRRLNVYKTSYRRLIDVETTSCVYWGSVSPPFIWCLYAVFGCKHFLTTINYFWRLYTTLDGYILLAAAICYFRQLYTTFNGYILLLALPDSDFVRIQDFLAIYRTYELQNRLEFSINWLTIMQFYFFCSSMVSSIIFSAPFWKCCFIRNTQMLKMWNLLQLALQMVRKANKKANNIYKLNP